MRSWGWFLLSVTLLTPLVRAEVVDRIVAAVNEDPILASEIDRVVTFGLYPILPGEDSTAHRRRVLDALIEQKLRQQEIERWGFETVSIPHLEEQFQRVRDRFASPGTFEARLIELELDEAGLKRLLARQLRVLTYVEERLGARIFIHLEDIETYYREVLGPELKASGKPIPEFGAIREEIRALLREERLNEELIRWTADLRRNADIEDYFVSEGRPLPQAVPKPDS